MVDSYPSATTCIWNPSVSSPSIRRSGTTNPGRKRKPSERSWPVSGDAILSHEFHKK